MPKKVRALQAADGNFSPRRDVHVQFDELVMSDGRRVSLQTVSEVAPDGVLSFIPANEKAAQPDDQGNAASKRARATRQAIKRQWSELQKQIHQPGKMHKLKRMLVARLPIHPQYLDAGTSFNANLKQSLDFGMESVKADRLTSIGAPPPRGSVVRARLVTPLTSATAKKGDAVEALITEPLVVSDRLILPQGSVIKGLVVQAQAARRLGRNGRLRILFHQVSPPDGVQQKVETSLEGVAVTNGENLKLDAEGGAQITTPRTRYLTTGIAVMLAASQMRKDGDAGRGNSGGGEAGGGAAAGALGFRLVGMIVGLAAHSRAVSAGFGSYGAALSVYDHFLARGAGCYLSKGYGHGSRTGHPQLKKLVVNFKVWA